MVLINCCLKQGMLRKNENQKTCFWGYKLMKYSLKSFSIFFKDLVKLSEILQFSLWVWSPDFSNHSFSGYISGSGPNILLRTCLNLNRYYIRKLPAITHHKDWITSSLYQLINWVLACWYKIDLIIIFSTNWR